MMRKVAMGLIGLVAVLLLVGVVLAGGKRAGDPIPEDFIPPIGCAAEDTTQLPGGGYHRWVLSEEIRWDGFDEQWYLFCRYSLEWAYPGPSQPGGGPVQVVGCPTGKGFIYSTELYKWHWTRIGDTQATGEAQCLYRGTYKDKTKAAAP